MPAKFLFGAVLFFQFYCISVLQGQDNSIEVQGFIYTSTKEALPYATVFNYTTNKGTISNSEGFFKLNIASYYDSVEISYMGYQKKVLLLENKVVEYEIILKESTYLLKEVTILPQNDDYLFDLIQACRKNQELKSNVAKAYYQLKTYNGGKQVELVENFYNATIQGYDLKKLQLKAGRLGLRKNNDRLFTSLESSKAIGMHHLFSTSIGFPINPLELTKRKLKKRYYLDVKQQYLDDNQDTILIVSLQPKKFPIEYFSSDVWIHKKKKNILKVSFHGVDLLYHPFLPLFPDDKIENMNIDIVKSFKEVEGKMVLEHIDFVYSFNYISRRSHPYSVKTKSVLQLYEHEYAFELPHFNLDLNLSDYRKINAFPYNDFFWKYNNELRVNDAIDSNGMFMEDVQTITNKKVFSKNEDMNNKLFEAPFIHWTGKRLLFKKIMEYSDNTIGSLFPEFDVLLFVDYSSYNDSNNVLSSVIFNPYASNYTGEYTPKVNCFLNMYFDLMEMERRNLMEKLKTTHPSEFKNTIEKCKKNMQFQKKLFFEETNFGKNMAKMIEWNQLIVDVLNIDNIHIFKLQDEK